MNRLGIGNKQRRGSSGISKNSPPSKEDILNTIEQFKGNQGENHDGFENNNIPVNKKLPYDHDYVNIDTASERHDISPSSTSFTHSYSTEWKNVFTKSNYLRSLRSNASKGYLRSSRFRSVCWKLFLEVLPEDVSQWASKTKEWRTKYTELKNDLIINPRNLVDKYTTRDLSLFNPLSQADESPWNQYFQDNELRLTIKQDVIRTFPEIEFFNTSEVRDIMANILFCVSRSNTNLSYKQGMHEILAPLIFILHCDHQAFLHAGEMEALDLFDSDTREIVEEIMNPAFIEHDAYMMFCQILETIEPWYLSKETLSAKGVDIYMTAQPFTKPPELSCTNAIVSKLTRIQDYILKKYDFELHCHLETLEIAPQIYGIRWVRLLFGREFPMQDLLVLWDALFADGISFDLVDYIFVAMLLFIRESLLASDYATCMSVLMKFPPVGDIHYIIDSALYLREPNQYPRPPPNMHQNFNRIGSGKKRETRESTNSRASFTNMLGLSSMTRKLSASGRPKTLSVFTGSLQKMSKSSSEPMNLQTDISPVSPVNPVQVKRGSTASLSQVEDSMYRSSLSAAGRFDSSAMTRSALSSPAGYSPEDELSSLNSPASYATLPRSKTKGKKISKSEQDALIKVSNLESQLSDKNNMCQYCTTKLDIHIDRLQSALLSQNMSSGIEDEVLLSLAGIKQVRDILKGTLKYSDNLIDYSDQIPMNNTHVGNIEQVPQIISPDCDKVMARSHDSSMLTDLPQATTGGDTANTRRKSMPDAHGNTSKCRSVESLAMKSEVELDDLRAARGRSVSHPLQPFPFSGPAESVFSDKQYMRNGRNGKSQNHGKSPNPLYNYTK